MNRKHGLVAIVFSICLWTHTGYQEITTATTNTEKQDENLYILYFTVLNLISVKQPG